MNSSSPRRRGAVLHTYRVFGLTNDGCTRAIEAELRKVEGIQLVEVDVARKVVRVGGDVSDVVVRSAIAAAGYGIADSVKRGPDS